VLPWNPDGEQELFATIMEFVNGGPRGRYGRESRRGRCRHGSCSAWQYWGVHRESRADWLHRFRNRGSTPENWNGKRDVGDYNPAGLCHEHLWEETRDSANKPRTWHRVLAGNVGHSCSGQLASTWNTALKRKTEKKRKKGEAPQQFEAEQLAVAGRCRPCEAKEAWMVVMSYLEPAKGQMEKGVKVDICRMKWCDRWVNTLGFRRGEHVEKRRYITEEHISGPKPFSKES
jgi:hypothetical protein